MPEPAPGDSVHEVDDAAASSPLVPDPPLPFAYLCARIDERVTAFLAEDAGSDDVLKGVQEQTRISLRVISEALDRYSLDEISLSYNGGKDCLVLLILYLAVLHSKGLTTTKADSTPHSPPQCVYIQAEFPFKEVEDFVASSVKTYCLSLVSYAKPMKAAFTDYLRDFPKVKAIFVGTRRTDPHGANLTHFDPTDQGWPEFMRIHPVIDWHYVEIWTFIRHLHVPYCPLYDQGYTSLGGTKDTHPNPALRRQASSTQNGEGPPKFRPAYELIEDDAERLGRDGRCAPDLTYNI